MSVTYTDSTMRNTSVQDEVFVPRYSSAKRTSRKGGVRTWMILAPIGAVVLIGAGVAMTMGGGTPSQPLVEPAPTSMMQPLAAEPAPLESAVAPAPLTAAPVAATPAATPSREAAPAPVTRRAAPAERRAAPPAPAVEPETIQPTGPQPYTPELNSGAPQGSSTPSPRAPAIQTAPLT